VVIDQIEAVLETIVDSLLHDDPEISITLRSRTRSRTQGRPTTCLSFPGRTSEEAWRFCEFPYMATLVLFPP
jgi:hypothetical protein